MRNLKEIDALRGALATLCQHHMSVKDANGQQLDETQFAQFAGMVMVLDWVAGEEVQNVTAVFEALLAAGYVPQGTTRGTDKVQ